jgi:ketosteroid isomerase-like protein
VKANVALVAAIAVLFSLPCAAQQSADEKAIWKLEHSYWEYVKANDLKSYLELWHSNFVGWPYVSAQPQGKDHITDWITANTDKGRLLKSYSLESAASHKTGDVIMVYYWVTATWADKDGNGEPNTLRVTHTWIKGDKGWQIVGGMSAAENNVKK